MRDVYRNRIEGEGHIIEPFQVGEKEAAFARMRGQHMLKAGEYVALKRKTGFRKVIMSDTPFERKTNIAFVQKAGGDVLIAGLGIGMTLLPVMSKASVKSVTVVENSIDVIKMAWPVLREYPGAEKVGVLHSDIFNWSTQTMFHTIWFDVWGSICADNLAQIHLLHKTWRDNLHSDGWMASWAQRLCRRSR